MAIRPALDVGCEAALLGSCEHTPLSASEVTALQGGIGRLLYQGGDSGLLYNSGGVYE